LAAANKRVSLCGLIGRRRKIDQSLVAVANGRVHEVGVGSGLNVPLYGKQVEFVFGIDPSPRLLAIVRRRAAPRPVSAPLSPEPEGRWTTLSAAGFDMTSL
jgi:SAM-dependent methyltransferase